MPLQAPPKYNDVHEFKPLLVEIEESPVSPLGRATFWIVVATMVFAVAWSILGQIDVVVTASGKVIPDGETKILQPLEAGVIRKIAAKVGDCVKKGQLLVEIDPSTVDPERESSAKNLSYAQLEMRRIAATLAGEKSISGGGPSGAAVEAQQNLLESAQSELDKQMEAKQAELASIEERQKSAQTSLDENKALLAVATDREKRMKEVLDLIARQDYEQVVNEITSYTSKMNQAAFQVTELQHQHNRVNKEIESLQHQFRRTNLQELSDKIRTVHELDARLKQSSFRTAKQRILSPVDGYVGELFVHTVGGVVTPAEKLMSIVPVNTPMVAKVSVLNRDIGFVSANLPVSIKVDTFEYQKYGMFQGKVKLVARDSREDQKEGLVYDVYVKPTTEYLEVEGRKEKLQPGMTVIAEIKVGTRRIIEFFIYPLIKYWHEGMSVR